MLISVFVKLDSIAQISGRFTKVSLNHNVTEITKFSVASACPHLTSIDISKNELTSLPESVAMLPNLEKFNASRNYLTELPAGYDLHSMSILHVRHCLIIKLEHNKHCYMSMIMQNA